MGGTTQQPAPGRSTAHKEYASYWSIVWEQFQKNRTSYFALWAIGGLFAIAIYAPAFSSKIPFFWSDADSVMLEARKQARRVIGATRDCYPPQATEQGAGKEQLGSFARVASRAAA